jgi:hypothetical protein
LTPTLPWVAASSPEPRKAKIFGPTLTTVSFSQGSSCQAPGFDRQYASSSSFVTG